MQALLRPSTCRHTVTLYLIQWLSIHSCSVWSALSVGWRCWTFHTVWMKTRWPGQLVSLKLRSLLHPLTSVLDCSHQGTSTTFLHYFRQEIRANSTSKSHRGPAICFQRYSTRWAHKHSCRCSHTFLYQTWYLHRSYNANWEVKSWHSPSNLIIPSPSSP